MSISLRSVSPSASFPWEKASRASVVLRCGVLDANARESAVRCVACEEDASSVATVMLRVQAIDAPVTVI